MIRLACVALVLAWTVPSIALAQDAEASNAPPSASAYLTKVRSGIRLAVARDFSGALSALQEAIQEDSSKPHAYYYIGEVHRMAGRLDEAVESFRTGVRIAAQAQDDMLHAHCLQGVAETLERKEGGLEQARAAWQEYVNFADTHRQVANPEIARARIQAIDTVIEQEQVYIAVRERIAERERANAEQGNNRNRRNRNSGN